MQLSDDDEALLEEEAADLSENDPAATDVPLRGDAPAARAPAQPQQPGQGLQGPTAPQLVTLSMLPRSVWQSLVHLDAIKVSAA